MLYSEISGKAKEGKAWLPPRHKWRGFRREESMKTKLIRIGNSKGIRIPKPILEQTGISDEVEMEVFDQHITIRSANKVRAHWEQAFEEMAQQGDDKLIDVETDKATGWDEYEWQW